MSGNTDTYGQLYDEAVRLLGSKFEAGQLFTHITQKKIYHLSFLVNKPVPSAQAELLIKMCNRRISGEPLQYLLGEWEFYSMPFKVGKGVLIPRADTEALVDVALEVLKDMENAVVLDLCSGTGCVAIAIAHHCAGADVTALELSEDAFPYLLENIKLNDSRVVPLKQDIKDYRHPKPIDVLVSNPPYIPKETILTLQRELKFEPKMALNGGNDGLDFYRAIKRIYLDQVKPGGWICLEIGIGQSKQVVKIMEESGLDNVQTRSDYSGVDRVVYGQKPIG